ncbi:polysaccharide deacetylase family protein [Siminovitchia sediminis]|uniref:Polysaccharide deacetylase family protein n=1 Tax=Siminovitchia sediminis TaxID=1274353 RepID=A0ABW4KG67_9BACI
MREVVKWKTPAGWIIFIIGFFLVIGGIGQFVSASIKTKGQEDSQINEQDVTIVPIDSHISKRITTKQGEQYTYVIESPELAGEETNRSINLWITEQIETFLTDVRETPSEIAGHSELHLKMEVLPNTETYYTLVFKIYTDFGGETGRHFVKAFNIDIEKDQFLTIGEMFDLAGKGEHFETAVLDELHQNQEIQEAVNVEALKQWILEPESWEWSLDLEEFTLYIDEADLFSGFAQVIEVRVPIEKLYFILHEEMESFLDMPYEQKQEMANIIQLEQMKRNPEGKYVALTFDDGPKPEVTPGILETLKKHQAKATFFMLGKQVNNHPELARKVVEEGHEIGNHSKSHPNLAKLGPSQIKAEMEYTKKKIEEATGVTPYLIRPPYGAYNDYLIQYAKDHGSPVILWSVDSLDWKIRNAWSVKYKIENGISPGGIVLMHDIHSTTADALPHLLSQLAKEGYQFVTVSQLLQWQEQTGTGPHFGIVKSR